MHLATETRAVGAPFRRCNTVDCQTVKQGTISRVPHLQRSIHVGFAKGVQGLARDLLHELAQENEINVGIDEPGVRWVRWLLVAGQFQSLVGTAPSAATQTGAQSRGVRQNLSYRDGLLAVGGEGREIMRQGVLVGLSAFGVGTFPWRGMRGLQRLWFFPSWFSPAPFQRLSVSRCSAGCLLRSCRCACCVRHVPVRLFHFHPVAHCGYHCRLQSCSCLLCRLSLLTSVV